MTEAPAAPRTAPLLNVADYESRAGELAERDAWDYMQGGAADEVTLRANTAAFQRIALRPRVLAGVTACDLSTSALGSPLRFPVMIAPVGYQRLADPGGECATARAAGAKGTLMAVSTMSNCTLEEVAEAATGPLWFQLYVMKDRGLTTSLVERAEAAGYKAIVLTADAPRLGKRERDQRSGFALPPHLRAGNLPSGDTSRLQERAAGASSIAGHADVAFDAGLSWDTLAWLRSLTKLPIVLKGVLTAEDAEQAARAGVAGLVVSNHGGRQLDSVSATIDVLAEVAGAAAGRCEVFLDGGIRRGTDVLKARALGARAVFVGRPMLWGLQVAGQAGVEQVLEILRAELELAMMLSGRASWETADRSLVARP